VNGCVYHGNVTYRCNCANVSLTKHVTSQLIVTRNEKLDRTKQDILDACRNSARFLSPLGHIRDVTPRSSSSNRRSLLMPNCYTKSLFWCRILRMQWTIKSGKTSICYRDIFVTIVVWQLVVRCVDTDVLKHPAHTRRVKICIRPPSWRSNSTVLLRDAYMTLLVGMLSVTRPPLGAVCLLVAGISCSCRLTDKIDAWLLYRWRKSHLTLDI
jgi:hypothetical protein